MITPYFNIIVSKDAAVPKILSDEDIQKMASFFCGELALNDKNYEINIIFVSPRDIQELNHKWRKKNKPTNILSFPLNSEDPANKRLLLGELYICVDVVIEEAQNQGKKLTEHFQHMLLHGILHLIGYTHEEKEDSFEMESLEASVLKKLGIKNPYEDINE